MTKYKYKILEVCTTDFHLERFHNIAKQGYRLVQAIPLPPIERNHGDWIMFIFEKKLVKLIGRKKHPKVVSMPKPYCCSPVRDGWEEGRKYNEF